jgi:hypothetical protein
VNPGPERVSHPQQAAVPTEFGSRLVDNRRFSIRPVVCHVQNTSTNLYMEVLWTK